MTATSSAKINPESPPIIDGVDDVSKVSKKDLRRVVLGTSVGSTLEYFDFSLYTLASSLIFANLFFSGVDPTIGRILSFATLFMGFAARPLGGLIFASVGDKLGRKKVLMITILMMGVSSLGIGLLPTYATIGVLSPILLVLLRIVQGFGAGAEAAGASTMMTEFAPNGKRGFYSSLQFSGLVGGTALASLAFLWMMSAGKQAVLDGLWRIPFLCSAILVIVAFWLRTRVKDSPAFNKMKEQQTVVKAPIRSVFKTGKKALFVGMGLRIGESAGSSIYKSLAASYLASVALSDRDDAGSVVSLSILCASAVGMVMVPVAGALSDRFGRDKLYKISTLFQLFAAVPIWYTLANGNDLAIVLVMALALGVGTWSNLGLNAAAIPELFGVQHRFTGVVLAREIPSLFAGGLVPTIGAALLVAYTDSWVPLAILTIVYGAFGVWAAFAMPDTRFRDLNSHQNAV